MKSKKTRYDPTLIASLKGDRISGFSIPQLMDKYNMPKTTVWHHIQGISLSPEMKRDIFLRKGGSRQRKIRDEAAAIVEAASLLQKSKRELLVATAMLYWAEGHKKTLVFTNTDAKMLRLYLRFLYEIFSIQKESVVVLIRTSDPINPKSAIRYWSSTLDLPDTCFSVNHDNRQNRTKTEFGICRVMVAKSGYYHKVMVNLIKGLQTDLLPL